MNKISPLGIFLFSDYFSNCYYFYSGQLKRIYFDDFKSVKIFHFVYDLKYFEKIENLSFDEKIDRINLDIKLNYIDNQVLDKSFVYSEGLHIIENTYYFFDGSSVWIFSDKIEKERLSSFYRRQKEYQKNVFFISEKECIYYGISFTKPDIKREQENSFFAKWEKDISFSVKEKIEYFLSEDISKDSIISPLGLFLFFDFDSNYYFYTSYLKRININNFNNPNIFLLLNKKYLKTLKNISYNQRLDKINYDLASFLDYKSIENIKIYSEGFYLIDDCYYLFDKDITIFRDGIKEVVDIFRFLIRAKNLNYDFFFLPSKEIAKFSLQNFNQKIDFLELEKFFLAYGKNQVVKDYVNYYLLKRDYELSLKNHDEQIDKKDIKKILYKPFFQYEDKQFIRELAKNHILESNLEIDKIIIKLRDIYK